MDAVQIIEDENHAYLDYRFCQWFYSRPCMGPMTDKRREMQAKLYQRWQQTLRRAWGISGQTNPNQNTRC